MERVVKMGNPNNQKIPHELNGLINLLAEWLADEYLKEKGLI